jgi:hypothetical protein
MADKVTLLALLQLKREGRIRSRASPIAPASGAQATAEVTARLVEEARRLEAAGASLLDFTNSGPVAGAQ